MQMPDGMWPAAILIFIFAGSIKGLVGVGMPTAAVSVFAQIADPRLAIALMLVPGLALNVWQVARSGQFVQTAKRVWPLAILMMAGIWYFARYAAGLPLDALLIGVGIVILVFVITSVLKPPYLPARYELPAQLGFGGLSGVMGGLTGIWSPAIVTYLLSRQVDRNHYLAATGILIFLGSAMLMLGYWQGGILTTDLAWQSALMVIPAMIGFAVGEWLRNKLGGEQFRYMVLFVFFLMGLNLIRRGWFA